MDVVIIDLVQNFLSTSGSVSPKFNRVLPATRARARLAGRVANGVDEGTGEIVYYRQQIHSNHAHIPIISIHIWSYHYGSGIESQSKSATFSIFE